MQRLYALAVVLGLALLLGCGSSRVSDSAVKETLNAASRSSASRRRPSSSTTRSSARYGKLRGEHASTATGRKGRALAIGGFTWTLRGIDARLEMTRNDSGNLEASVRDAVRGDRDLRKGARLLRAAGRSLGIRIGKLNGF